MSAMFEKRLKRSCIFVLAQDYGHFAYTTHLARVLHSRGYAIEYWSHKSAHAQCPEYATFNWLSDAQSFTDFYCHQSSHGDDDLQNITRMSANINSLMCEAFPGCEAEGADSPLLNISGEQVRVDALKARLLQPDVVLCVNDKCHLFSWAGQHCEKYGVPTLNLCPSQHELQRSHAGVLDEWEKIFTALPWPEPSPDKEYAHIRREGEEEEGGGVPVVVGLYVTFLPLLADPTLLPPGTEVVGPVYMEEEAAREQQEQLLQGEEGGLLRWMESETDPRPVVYISLGSMIRKFTAGEGAAQGIRELFRALLPPSSPCRVLTTIPPELYRDFLSPLLGTEAFRFSPWVPQFAVLGHPRVRAFVSHCGANSVHEAIFHAVPIVAVPFFDDQRYNGPRLVELGLAAASLSKDHMTSEQGLRAVQEGLQSLSLREKMEAASKEAREANGLGRLVVEAEKLIAYSERHPHRL